MSAVKEHVEKIVFVVVLLAALGFLAMTFNTAEPPNFAELEANQQKIEAELNTGMPSAKYGYSKEAAEKVAKIKDQALKNLNRADADIAEGPQFAFYPQPMRPAYADDTKPHTEDQLTTHVTAVLSDLTEISARGDYGSIFITYRLPQDMKLMEAVRVEIFRGESETKIDLKSPYAVVEHAAEEQVHDEKVIEEKPKEVETVKKTEPTRRRREDEPVETSGPKDREKKVELPAEFAGIQVHKDTRVDGKKPYYYQLRLVGKVTVSLDKPAEEKTPHGVKKTYFHGPKEGVPVLTKSGKANLLFATPMSKVITATPPSNFEIRLAGSLEEDGKIAPPGTAEYRLKDYTGYKGRFEVRAWVKDAQEFKDDTIEVGPGERLKGSLEYRSADTKEKLTYEFDTGYTLVEMSYGEQTQKFIERKPVVDSNGNPIMQNGVMKVEEIEREGEKFYKMRALLKDNLTGKTHEVWQGHDPSKREKLVEYLRRAALDQQADREERKRKQDELREKIKKNNAQPAPGTGPTPGTGMPGHQP